MAFEVKNDQEECIACGACASICEDNWEIPEGEKARPIKTRVNEIGCNQEAADSCPVSCITIKKV